MTHNNKKKKQYICLRNQILNTIDKLIGECEYDKHIEILCIIRQHFLNLKLKDNNDIHTFKKILLNLDKIPEIEDLKNKINRFINRAWFQNK